MISRRARSTTAALCLFLAGWAPEASAQDTFNWNTDSNGSWHDGFNWDQGTAPNGVSDVVVISRPAANPTVSYTALSGARLVASLVSEEAIVLTGGSLEVLTNAEFIGTFTLMGGTLKGGVIVATSGIEVGSSQNSRVDGITLDGNLELTGSSDYLGVLNGLTLNGTAHLSGYSSRLDFAGTQSFGASSGQTATVEMGEYNTKLQVTDGGTLTLESTVTVVGEGTVTGSGTGDAIINNGLIHANQDNANIILSPETFTNTGTLRASNGGRLSLKNDWDNNGTIELDSGRLYLYGDNETADLNQPSFVRVGASAVYLAGSLDNTGDTLSQVGTIDFIGGSVVGGTSNVDFNATSNMSEFADGVTLNADLNLAGSNSHFEIQNGLTLNGTAHLSGYSSRLDFAGTQSFGASSGQTATVEMGEYNTKLQVTDGGTLTLESTVTVVGEGTVTGSGTGDAIINNGLIHANQDNANIILSPETFTNTGTLRASNNGGLSLKNDWDNNGTIELDSGRLYLYGDNETADLNQPSFVRVGASAVYLAGSLDNTGDTLSQVGTIDFIGGSVVGGTSNVDFNATSNMSEFADGVTLNADLNLAGSNSHFEIQNGLTLNGTAHLSGYSSRLDFAGTQSFGASSGQTATVEMGEYNTKLQVTDGGTLTLESTVTVVGEGTVTGSGTGDAIINNGLIHANQDNANIILSPETFTNTGTLRASNNGGLSLKNDWDNNGTIELDSGRLYLYGDNETADLNQPSFVRVGASAVYLAGSLDNTGDTLSQVGTIDFIGGSVVGGTSNVDFNATSNMSEFADGVTLNADLNLAGSNSHFEIQNGLTLNGTAHLSGYSSRLDFAGTQSFGASSGQTATVEMGEYNTKLQVTDGGTLTLESTVTVVGEGTVTGSGTGDAIINNGLIHANQDNANIILSPETFTNTGTLRASNNGGLSLKNDWDNNGTIELDSGRLYLYGDNETADLNQPSFVRVGASAVYLAGSLDNTGDTLSQVGTIDFIGGSVVGGTSNVDFNATSNMSEFADGVTLNADLNLAGSNSHFEIQNGLTLNGTAHLSGYSSRLDFAGTQSFGASSGQTATVEMGEYNTKLQVTDGGTLTLESTVTVVGEGTVTGSGTGDAIINNGLIHANQDNANIILSPETFTNTGTLRASNGGRLALASGTFENHGVIEVLEGSQLVTTGLGASGLEIETGASLGGGGSVIGNVTNTAGTVAPGATLGTLAITGDFFQESEGELSIELSGMTQGTESDFLDISGSATIDGVLRTSLLGGFMPDESDTFIILEADGGVFGTFSSVFDPGGNAWSVTYGATQVILKFEQAAVPEPGTALLLGFGLAGLAVRRRTRRGC